MEPASKPAISQAARRTVDLRFVELTDKVRRNRPGDGLTQRGHQIKLHGAYSATMGGGQAVQRDISTAVNFGASDPRKDGEAIPEPSPQK
jgi:gamma-glutamyltranspeptidase